MKWEEVTEREDTLNSSHTHFRLRQLSLEAAPYTAVDDSMEAAILTILLPLALPPLLTQLVC